MIGPGFADEVGDRMLGRILIVLAIIAAICLGIGYLTGRALAGDLPDPSLTPGAANPALTKQVLCAKGFTTRTVRNVPSSEKREVYARYGMEPHKGACSGKEGCEVDHLIPLTAGGSNDITNLWPQSYAGQWGAHAKDKLENKLRPLVCSGKLDLAEAQHAIASDWKAFYRRIFGR